MGYLLQPTSSIIDGQYNPSLVIVSNLQDASPIAAEFNYQIFPNSVNIAGWVYWSLEEFRTLGSFKINLPNLLIGTIQAECRGTWSNTTFTNTLTTVVITEELTDLNYPILFTIRSAAPEANGDFQFNLIYTFK
jgi:hypothetical protein